MILLQSRCHKDFNYLEILTSKNGGYNDVSKKKCLRTKRFFNNACVLKSSLFICQRYHYFAILRRQPNKKVAIILV